MTQLSPHRTMSIDEHRSRRRDLHVDQAPLESLRRADASASPASVADPGPPSSPSARFAWLYDYVNLGRSNGWPMCRRERRAGSARAVGAADTIGLFGKSGDSRVTSTSLDA